MFQNVNVAKSAPFALLTIYQKSLYPPKVLKLPHFGKLRKIRRPFFDLNTRNETLQFHSKLRENRSIHHPQQ